MPPPRGSGGWGSTLPTATSAGAALSGRARVRLDTDGVEPMEGPDLAGAVAVRNAIVALPARQRSALILRYYLDLPVEDAARHMEASPDAVR